MTLGDVTVVIRLRVSMERSFGGGGGLEELGLLVDELDVGLEVELFGGLELALVAPEYLQVFVLFVF